MSKVGSVGSTTYCGAKDLSSNSDQANCFDILMENLFVFVKTRKKQCDLTRLNGLVTPALELHSRAVSSVGIMSPLQRS